MAKSGTSFYSRLLRAAGFVPMLAVGILLAFTVTACQTDRTTGQGTAEPTRDQPENQYQLSPEESAARGIVVELLNNTGKPLAGLSLQYPGGLLSLVPIAAEEGIKVTVVPDLEQGGELRLLYRNSADQVTSLALPGLLSPETEGPIRVSIRADGTDGLLLSTVS